MRAFFFLLIIASFLSVIVCCQTNDNTGSKLNLGFEDVQNGAPKGWYIYSQKNYSVSLDSLTVKSGKYSINIESTGDSVLFQPVTLVLPNNYAGKQITLSGYIKTENVTDGYAGLWMRIDPQIAFENMHQNGITGTIDWKTYEITLDMDPAKTQQIVLGGLLVGKGKMWLDDLRITIDGKDIKDSKIHDKGPLLTEKDRVYDTGSNIVIPIQKETVSSINESLIANLELLGKLWGFLKYHHPEVGKGNYNWDYELFRMLPEYLKVTEIDQRDKILLRWIEKYGKIPECKTCKETPVEAFLKPDLSWIDNSNMNLNLKQKAKEVYRNRHQGEHFYIQMEPGVGNPKFLNENPYSNMPYPDAGFRLLALYRYWNMIHYFFPYKHLTNKNWNDVLKEYIPKFVSAKTELEYELAALQLIGEVNDTHANLWGGEDKIALLRGNWHAPFQIRFIENKWIVIDYDKPELKETIGLNVGDIITHINEKEIESIVDSIRSYYPASNEAARMRNIANDLLRSRNEIIKINYIASNQIKQKDLNLSKRKNMQKFINDKSICYKLLNSTTPLLNDNIGYITLESIKKEDINKIKADFKDTKGIIIDIRSYPSFFVPFLLGSYFVSETTPFVKFTIGNPDNPGEFTFTSTLEIPKSEEFYPGKLVVIVNENTQSQAEYTAMAFRAGDNTTIIGSQTAGADGNLSNIVLPGGLKTSISGIGVYYPDGQETQRVGIVPNIEVKPTIQGIIENRDELLEKAIEIIKQK